MKTKNFDSERHVRFYLDEMKKGQGGYTTIGEASARIYKGSLYLTSGYCELFGNWTGNTEGSNSPIYVYKTKKGNYKAIIPTDVLIYELEDPPNETAIKIHSVSYFT